jgi:hypothetical protein
MKATRREVLKGTAALATSTAVAGTALASGVDGHLLALSEQYWELVAEGLRLDRSTPGRSTAVRDAIYDRIGELDSEAVAVALRLLDMPAHTAEGLAAKLRIVRHEAGYPVKLRLSDMWEPCQQAVALGLWTAMEDAARLGGRVSL